MSSTPSTLSASVTRILSLTGFPKELKTKDIQTAFSEWETQNGGFKIKWIDDTSLYIVFQDPTVAKRAYLRTVAFPPATFISTEGLTAIIKPYDGPDAQQVIQAINARQNANATRRSASISVPSARGGRSGHASSFSMAVSGGVPLATVPAANGGVPERSSPTLPDLPSHPTLESLMNSSLGGGAGGGLPPRIGDPGKRMVAHGLGVRHPSLGQKNGASVTSPPQEALSRAIGVSE